MDMASLIIALLALLGSIYTYFKHDKRLKKQELLLQEYQLATFKKDDEDSKKAAFVVDSYYIGGTDGGRVVFKNIGKADARNVKWHYSIDAVHGLKDGEHIQLSPQQELSHKYVLFSGDYLNKPFSITLVWEDDYATHNEKEFWDTAKLPWMNFSDSAKNA